MIKEFAHAVRARIQVQIRDYTEDVAKGRCEDIEEYKHLCGQIRGLELAEECLMDLVQKVQEDDDGED